MAQRAGRNYQIKSLSVVPKKMVQKWHLQVRGYLREDEKHGEDLDNSSLAPSATAMEFPSPKGLLEKKTTDCLQTFL